MLGVKTVTSTVTQNVGAIFSGSGTFINNANATMREAYSGCSQREPFMEGWSATLVPIVKTIVNALVTFFSVRSGMRKRI